MHVEVRQLENAKHATAPDGIEEEAEPVCVCCKLGNPGTATAGRVKR